MTSREGAAVMIGITGAFQEVSSMYSLVDKKELLLSISRSQSGVTVCVSEVRKMCMQYSEVVE